MYSGFVLFLQPLTPVPYPVVIARCRRLQYPRQTLSYARSGPEYMPEY